MSNRFTRTLDERFREKVDTSQGCWTWTGSRTRDGYGRMKVDGRVEYAHRVSWVLVHGPIADGQDVCHRCDNPPCVRLSHLFLGSRKENMQDAIRKARPLGRRPDQSCVNGHAFDEENTFRYERDGKPRRGCKACRTAAGQRHRTNQVHHLGAAETI